MNICLEKQLGLVTEVFHEENLKNTITAVRMAHPYGAGVEAELGALRLFEKRLPKGKKVLPDLIYSADDYLTRGMLTAFAHHGVRVPEDVRVVTFANRGNGPWYFKSLARIEVDPMFLGEKLADRAIRMLDGKPPLAPIAYPAKYIDGETFP